MRYRTRIVALTAGLLGLAAVGLLLFTQISIGRELDHYLAPEQVEAAVHRTRIAALAMFAIILVPACVIAWLIGRSVAHPLESTEQAVRRMAEILR